MLRNSKKIIIVFLFSTILILIGAIGYWWYEVQHNTTQMGRLNISKISKDNRLKIVQQDIDFLVDISYPNGGYYTAIIPFTVQAGFELEKVEIIEKANINTKEGRAHSYIKKADASTPESGSLTINLPEPRILNSDIADDQEYVILRDDKSGGNFDLTKAYEIFGKKFIEQTALDNRILSTANQEAVKVLKDLAKNVYPENIKIEINTVEPKRCVKKVDYKCGTMPIYFSLFEKDTLGWEIQGNSTEAINIGHYGFKGTLDSGLVDIKLTRAGKANDLDSYMKRWAPNFGRLFSPLDPDLRVYLHFEDTTELACYYLLNGFVYELSIKGADKDTLNKNLERVFPLILNLRLDKTFSLQENCNYDDYGLMKSMWANWSIDKKRNYFNDLFLHFSKFNESNLKSKTYSPRISIIYDKNENESEEDFFENITQTIKRIVEHDSSIHGYLSDEDFKNDCIGAIYNKNIIHRDRYVFFMSDKVIFCTPNRKWGLKLAGLIPLTILAKDKNAQDFVSKVVPYGKFNTNCGGTLSIKDQNIVFAEDFVGKKAIHSENLTKFLIWLVSDDNRTFIDLFKSEHTPIT